MNRRNFISRAASTSLVVGGPIVFGAGKLFAAGPMLYTNGDIPSSNSDTPELLSSMLLAGQNLIDCLSADHNMVPFWELRIEPDKTAAFNMWWPQHNIGRWWDALLQLEDCSDFRIPGGVEKAMLKNTYRFYDNPDNLCFQPTDFEKEIFPLELHSLREGLLCLNALVRYRNSRWAREKAKKMLQTIGNVLNDDCTWNIQRLDYYKKCGGRQTDFLTGAVETNGRLLEALVWYFETTGEAQAFSLANKIARWHIQNTVNPDGTIKTPKPDHTHSHFGTLRGLFLYGKLTRDQTYIDRVESSFRTTVLSVVKESGFTSHDLGREMRGETTSPGDAAQLALWLGLHGYRHFFDDAERLLRARLLPCQIISGPELTPKRPAKEGDRYRDLTKRMIGAYGGMHTHPHGGKINTTDITSAVIHSICDLYRHSVVHDADATFVNLHFSCADKHITIKVHDGDNRNIEIVYRRARPLFVRIPRWAQRDALRLVVNGAEYPAEVLNDAVCIISENVPANISMTFPLPARTVKETTNGTEFTIRWKGDTITGITPNTDNFPFYPSM